MFNINVHCDRFSSPRKEKYYANTSYRVPEFIIISHINKYKNAFGYNKTGRIKKWKRRVFEEFNDAKQESILQKTRKHKNALLHVVTRGKCNTNLKNSRSH
jgi:hypothetical protein